MSKITQRYASAIHSGNLVSDPETTMSDTDVLGAFGLAGKPTHELPDGTVVKGRPVAVALTRYFSGDDKEGHELVRLLAQMLWSKAERLDTKPHLRRVESEDIARAVLGWFRDSACPACSGHGYEVIGGPLGNGRAVVGNVACSHCNFGKRPFLTEFKTATRRDLAQWLHDWIDREQHTAGPAAMAALAPRLDFLQPR